MAEITDFTTVELNEAVEVDWDNSVDAERKFDLDVADEKFLILIDHGGTDGAENLVVRAEAGDFIQKGYGDVTSPEIAAGEQYVMVVESGVVKDEDGEVILKLEEDDGDDFGTDSSDTLDDIGIAVVQLSYSTA